MLLYYSKENLINILKRMAHLNWNAIYANNFVSLIYLPTREHFIPLIINALNKNTSEERNKAVAVTVSYDNKIQNKSWKLYVLY